MEEAHADKELIDYFSLKETEFYPEFVAHTITKCGRVKGERDITTVEHWSRLRKIDHGSFGTVFLEQERSGALRAVKVLQKRSQDERNFVKFYGWYEDVEQLYIAMEYYELGNLAACVRGPLPEDQARRIAWQITSGLKLMHDQQFTHRDIKPSNILVQSSGPLWWVKVADFSISKRVLPDASGLYTAFHGEYVAPEVINLVDEDDDNDEDKYTNAVDMWSLGYLTHWLIAYKKAFIDTRELKQYCKGRAGFYDAGLKGVSASQGATKFIQALLAPRPRKRLSAKQALEHSWLQLTFTSKTLTPMPKSAPLEVSKLATLAMPKRPLSTGQGLVPPVDKDESPQMSRPLNFGEAGKAVQAETDASRGRSNKDNTSQNDMNHKNNTAPKVENFEDTSLNDKNAEVLVDDVESQVLKNFKAFAKAERKNLNEQRRDRLKRDKAVKFNDLKKFSREFHLKSGPPKDLVPILTKDKSKQASLIAHSIEAMASQDPQAVPVMSNSMPTTGDQKPGKPTTRANTIIANTETESLIRGELRTASPSPIPRQYKPLDPSVHQFHPGAAAQTPSPPAYMPYVPTTYPSQVHAYGNYGSPQSVSPQYGYPYYGTYRSPPIAQHIPTYMLYPPPDATSGLNHYPTQAYTSPLPNRFSQPPPSTTPSPRPQYPGSHSTRNPPQDYDRGRNQAAFRIAMNIRYPDRPYDHRSDYLSMENDPKLKTAVDRALERIDSYGKPRNGSYESKEGGLLPSPPPYRPTTHRAPASSSYHSVAHATGTLDQDPESNLRFFSDLPPIESPLRSDSNIPSNQNTVIVTKDEDGNPLTLEFKTKPLAKDSPEGVGEASGSAQKLSRNQRRKRNAKLRQEQAGESDP